MRTIEQGNNLTATLGNVPELDILDLSIGEEVLYAEHIWRVNGIWPESEETTLFTLQLVNLRSKTFDYVMAKLEEETGTTS